jgi:hypothetical protein
VPTARFELASPVARRSERRVYAVPPRRQGNIWCARQKSNLDARGLDLLKVACLPVPPRAQESIWGDRRVLTPRLPGSRPGALPLSYGQHGNRVDRHQANPPYYRHISPRPWPCAMASRLQGRSRPPRRGAGSDGSMQETGTGRPQDSRPHPHEQARDGSCRQGEPKRRQAVLLHRGPAFAAPPRQSELLESFRAAACPPVSVGNREDLGALAREQRKTPGKPFGLPGVP